MNFNYIIILVLALTGIAVYFICKRIAYDGLKQHEMYFHEPDRVLLKKARFRALLAAVIFEALWALAFFGAHL